MEGLLSNIDVYSFVGISILIISGFIVGIINTIAGAGTAITYYVFMLFGLSSPYSNGTTRLGVILQTLIATIVFKRGKILNVNKGLWLGVPVTLGSIIGASLAISINKNIFEIIVGIIMIGLLALQKMERTKISYIAF